MTLKHGKSSKVEKRKTELDVSPTRQVSLEEAFTRAESKEDLENMIQMSKKPREVESLVPKTSRKHK
jgi:hypothetical protein